jgi:hypothetical protein
MIERTVIYRTKAAARVEVPHSEKAFPIAFLALAFGLISGVTLAGVVIPAVVHTVVPIVVRVVTGA